MQVVIDIPQELFARNYNGWCDKQDVVTILNAVVYGTPLPEHYGDLIDKKQLKKCIPLEEFGALFAIETAPVIIPATKGDEYADSD